MRVRTVLLLTATATALFAPVAQAEPAAPQAAPTAQELLAATADCAEQVSNGEYATDDGGEATVPVCAKNDAVYWTADFDVDCDGQATEHCNADTDPSFYEGTAWSQSDGNPLIADQLPYVVVPQSSDIWDYAGAGIENETGNAVAVVYNDTVVYAVVGDSGPEDIIGEGSYALADALGIDPDPATGGTDGPVTYIALPGEKFDPVEDAGKATEVGQRLAAAFVAGVEHSAERLAQRDPAAGA